MSELKKKMWPRRDSEGHSARSPAWQRRASQRSERGGGEGRRGPWGRDGDARCMAGGSLDKLIWVAAYVG